MCVERILEYDEVVERDPGLAGVGGSGQDGIPQGGELCDRLVGVVEATGDLLQPSDLDHGSIGPIGFGHRHVAQLHQPVQLGLGLLIPGTPLEQPILQGCRLPDHQVCFFD